MKINKRNIATLLLAGVTALSCVGCGSSGGSGGSTGGSSDSHFLGIGDVTETPSVSFGFKAVDNADNYNETLSAFEVGKRFYTCIEIKINTDKKKAHDYKVEVTVPKTKDVELERSGGLIPDSKEWLEEEQLTKMVFTVKGYREATSEKILFHATPTGEGEAEMTVHIRDEDGNEINSGYSRTVFFEYELNTGE